MTRISDVFLVFCHVRGYVYDKDGVSKLPVGDLLYKNTISLTCLCLEDDNRRKQEGFINVEMAVWYKVVCIF